MPKTVKNKKYVKSYTNQAMQAAINAVNSGQKMFRAAKEYGIPFNSLKDQMKRIKNNQPATFGTPTHLTADEEAKIVN